MLNKYNTAAHYEKVKRLKFFSKKHPSVHFTFAADYCKERGEEEEER